MKPLAEVFRRVKRCAGVEVGRNMLVGLEGPCAGSARATIVTKQWTARAVTLRVAILFTTSTLLVIGPWRG